MDETWQEAFKQRMERFAVAVGKSAEDVMEALKAIIGEPNDGSLALLADETSVTFDDLKGVLVSNGPKIPIAVLRSNLNLLRGKEKAAAPGASEAPRTAGVSLDVLPSIPDDESFLAALKVGGIQKIEAVDVIAAVKAKLADQAGLYDLPDTLQMEMERFADEQAEPCGEEYFTLLKLVRSRAYADVLSALGVDGRFVSKDRQTKLLNRVSTLWNSCFNFQQQLDGWRKAWLAGAGDPSALIVAMTTAMGGGGMMPPGMMPPGMMQPPDTAPVRDEAERVIEDINKVFAGPGIPVARALAWDAQRIKKILADPRLPAAVGSANYEQMIKKLGVGVTAADVRVERNVAKYMLAIMELPKVTSGQSEYGYLGAMIQLGMQIPWDVLLNKAGAGAGKPGRAKPY